jgi:uncharacterized membrane protein YfcA
MPSLQTLLALLIRHALGAIGGGLGLSADLDEQSLQAIVGALMVLISVGWSAWEKRSDKPEDIPMEVQPKIFTGKPTEAPRPEEDKWVG